MGRGPTVSVDTWCLHELIEVRVRQQPQAIAVMSADESLTYAELNARANRLARYLRSHGVGPDVLVGVAMSRSPAMLVSLLAILKAGGAYVPLDPGLPHRPIDLHDRGCRLELGCHSVGPAGTTGIGRGWSRFHR